MFSTNKRGKSREEKGERDEGQEMRGGGGCGRKILHLTDGEGYILNGSNASIYALLAKADSTELVFSHTDHK